MGNGLAGCSDIEMDTSNLQKMSQVNMGKCSVCPANLHQSCGNTLGPEWDFDYSQTEGVGCKAVCKRIGYTNTDPSCCLGIQSADSKRTCKPELNRSSPACVGPITTHCAQDNNIGSEFCTSVPPSLKYNILSTYCNNIDNIKNKPICRGFVSGLEHAGKADDLMSKYCTANPNDDLCCFMTSSIPCPNKFDSRCFNKASYQTSAMLATKCPDVMNCNQYATLDPSAKAFATNVQMNCGKTTASGNTVTPIKKKSGFPPELYILFVVFGLASYDLYKN